MVQQYLNSVFVGSPVATFNTLPGTAAQGEVRLVISENALYQFNGTVWINVGIPGTGSFRADGSVKAEGNWNIDGFKLLNLGQLTASSGTGFDLLSKLLNVAGQSALTVDTINAITDGAARLLSLKVQGVEKFGVDPNGDIVVGGGLSSTGNVDVFLDRDNDDLNEAFTVYQNVTTPTPGNELFQVRANGEVEIFGGPLIGGTSPFELQSKEADGASAEAVVIDTQNLMSTTGAKLLVVKNQGTEVWSVDKDGISSGGFVTVVKPSEGGAGIQAAVNTIATAGGGIVQLLEGTYAVSTAITMPATANNVMIRGVGDSTIIQTTSVSHGFNFSTSPFDTSPINAVTATDTSIFMTTPGDATPYVAGDRVMIEGTDPSGRQERVFNIVKTAGNPSSGEIELVYPIYFSLSSGTFTPQVTGMRNFNHLTVRDMKITASPFNPGYSAVRITHSYNALIENITMENHSIGVNFTNYSVRPTVRNCRINTGNIASSNGIFFSKATEILIEECIIEDIDNIGINFRFTCNDVVIKNCLINGVNGTFGNGIALTGDSGHYRRFLIDGNILERIHNNGVIVAGGSDVRIVNNIFKDCADRTVVAVIELNNVTKKVVIAHNHIIRAKLGINLALAEDCSVIGNTIEDIYSGGTSPYGISVSGTGHVVKGNIIRNSFSNGILAVATSCSILDNIVTDTSAPGMRIAACTNMIVAQNHIRNSTGVGLLVDNTCTNSIFSVNHTNGDGITMGTGTGNDFVNNK